MRICLLQISKSISTPTPQSAGSKVSMVCWFVLGEHDSSQKNGNEFFGFIKNFFLNEEVN